MAVIRLGKHINSCPDCGNDTYTVKTRVSGYIYSNHNFDKSITEDSSQMYDYLGYPNKDSKCYCMECNTYLGIYKTDE